MCKQIYKISRQRYNLHWGKSDKLVSAFIDRYNQGKSLGSQLRSAHYELAKILVRTYSKQLSYHQAYIGELTPQQDQLPMLETNNTFLANEMKCCTRKVRYLRTRLRQAGFITGKVYRGQNAQYRLEITPQALYLQLNNHGENRIHEFMAAFQSLQNQAPQPAPPPAPPENFATYSNQLKEAGTLNYILSGAPFAKTPDAQSVTEENSVNSSERAVENPKGSVQKPQSGAAQERSRNIEAGNTHSQANSGVAKTNEEAVAPSTKPFVTPEKAPQTLGQAIAHLPEDLRDRLRNMISVLWLCADDVLYSDKYLEEEEIEAGKACLAEYFCYSSPNGWTAGSKEVMRRMTLVKLWVERGHRVGIQRFVPIPGSYFDIRKPFGFGQTKAWFKQDQIHQREITDRAQLTKACREYTRSLEAGAKYSTADTYGKWKQRLGKRSPELLEKFHKYIAHAGPNSGAGTAA